MLGFDGLPYLARSTFRHEQLVLIAAGLGLTIAMDGFPQLFLKKGFSGSDWLPELRTSRLVDGPHGVWP